LQIYARAVEKRGDDATERLAAKFRTPRSAALLPAERPDSKRAMRYGTRNVDSPADSWVEVSGLEPPTSTLRMSGSRCFDQGLSENFPGSGVSIPSGSLTIPLLPSR
jgi:hypothetical protein